MEVFMLASLVVVALVFFKWLGERALPIVIIVIFIWGLVAYLGGFFGIDFFQR